MPLATQVLHNPASVTTAADVFSKGSLSHMGQPKACVA